ncbi:hypothetical protein M405DRAFT_360576 [Rhizopogon salebrosus TDB-379]|nr:hypothetical protein M405DRAFT_360576 [Rhizopogon salebrosus TDB-379]
MSSITAFLKAKLLGASPLFWIGAQHFVSNPTSSLSQSVPPYPRKFSALLPIPSTTSMNYSASHPFLRLSGSTSSRSDFPAACVNQRSQGDKVHCLPTPQNPNNASKFPFFDFHYIDGVSAMLLLSMCLLLVSSLTRTSPLGLRAASCDCTRHMNVNLLSLATEIPRLFPVLHKAASCLLSYFVILVFCHISLQETWSRSQMP